MSHKILIIGKRKTGKTSLRTLLSFDYFLENYSPSESVSMSSRSTPQGNFLFVDAFELNPILFDHRFACVFLMFDQSSQDSITDLDSFHQSLKPHTNLFFLIGNKSDLQPSLCESSIQNLSHHLQIRFFPISCKTGSGLDDLWESLLIKLNNSSK